MRAVTVAMAGVARGIRAALHLAVRITRALILRVAVTLAVMAVGRLKRVGTLHASTVEVLRARVVGRAHRGH